MKYVFFPICFLLLFIGKTSAQIHAPRIKNQNNINKTIEGSKYIDPIFTEARISSLTKIVMVRYDAFNEMFEFVDPNETNKDTFLIQKTEQNKTIILLNSQKKYSLENCMGKDWTIKSTYCVEVKTTEKIALYKKEKVIFIPEKMAENSMKRGFPARYTRIDDEYYIKKDNEDYLIIFPSSKKELIKMFPEKKEKIENYFKNNKNNFKSEADYITLFDLLL